MKRRTSFIFPLVLFAFLSAAFILWQMVWIDEPQRYPEKLNFPHTYDVSDLGKLHFLKDYKEIDPNTLLHYYGYNVLNSLSISSNREVPDTRPAQCQPLTIGDGTGLASTSVIITYQDVDRSVLLRNIVSILKGATPAIIKEVIVVNDGSSDVEAGQLLASLPGFQIIRNQISKGRALARMQGAEAASGEVLVFIDPLIEMNVDWLSPLLLALKKNPKSVTSPVFDRIDHQTFEYKALPGTYRGGLDWSLQFHWVDVPLKEQQRSDPNTPFRTPVQNGAVLALRKDFFDWIGRNDKLLSATGMEDIELSLRVWLCGGQLEIVPCSRAGMLQTYGGQFGTQRIPFTTGLRGAKRVAEMWLDDYKRFFYAVRPSARMQPMSDLSSFRKTREQRKCQNFKWYLSSVYPQLLPLVSDEIAYGVIRQHNNCIDLDPGQLPLVAKLRPCNQDKDSQSWSWRKKGLIVSSGMCLTSDLTTMKGYVVVQFCKDLDTQIWFRTELQVVHQETGLCLDSVQGGRLGLKLARCEPGLASQVWHISSEGQGLTERETEPDFSFSEDARSIEI